MPHKDEAGKIFIISYGCKWRWYDSHEIVVTFLQLLERTLHINTWLCHITFKGSYKSMSSWSHTSKIGVIPIVLCTYPNLKVQVKYWGSWSFWWIGCKGKDESEMPNKEFATQRKEKKKVPYRIFIRQNKSSIVSSFNRSVLMILFYQLN